MSVFQIGLECGCQSGHGGAISWVTQTYKAEGHRDTDKEIEKQPDLNQREEIVECIDS